MTLENSKVFLGIVQGLSLAINFYLFFTLFKPFFSYLFFLSLSYPYLIAVLEIVGQSGFPEKNC